MRAARAGAPDPPPVLPSIRIAGPGRRADVIAICHPDPGPLVCRIPGHGRFDRRPPGLPGLVPAPPHLLLLEAGARGVRVTANPGRGSAPGFSAGDPRA